jgi:hypothetical protein
MVVSSTSLVTGGGSSTWLPHVHELYIPVELMAAGTFIVGHYTAVEMLSRSGHGYGPLASNPTSH